MNLFTRLSSWFTRITTPPERPIPCILTDPSGRRTFKLHGQSNWFSSMAWTDLPEVVIGEFAAEFNESNGDELHQTPYIQFYVGNILTPPSRAGVSTFDDAIGTTFTLARGKIWPTPESCVAANGMTLTFTNVRMEFTVPLTPRNPTLEDMVHIADSITITPTGQIVVD